MLCLISAWENEYLKTSQFDGTQTENVEDKAPQETDNSKQSVVKDQKQLYMSAVNHNVVVLYL